MPSNNLIDIRIYGESSDFQRTYKSILKDVQHQIHGYLSCCKADIGMQSYSRKPNARQQIQWKAVMNDDFNRF